MAKTAIRKGYETMKKKVTILLLIISIVFCASGGYFYIKTAKNAKAVKDYNMMNVSDKGDYLIWADLDYDAYSFGGNDIAMDEYEITQETALDIGNAVLKDIYQEQWREFFEETEYMVISIEKQDMYIVSRAPVGYVGDGSYVAINKKDGKILRIWFDAGVPKSYKR